MNADDLKIINLVMALAVTAGIVCWAVILLQAFFHDMRIAIVGLFGALLAAYAYFFSETGGEIVRVIAAVINFGFVIWFLIKNIRKWSVWLPVSLFIISAGTVMYFLKSYDNSFGI